MIEVNEITSLIIRDVIETDSKYHHSLTSIRRIKKKHRHKMFVYAWWNANAHNMTPDANYYLTNYFKRMITMIIKYGNLVCQTDAKYILIKKIRSAGSTRFYKASKMCI